MSGCVDFDQFRVRQSGGEMFGMVETHGTVVSGGQDQRRLSDVVADIGRRSKIDKEAPTGLAAQQELLHLHCV